MITPDQQNQIKTALAGNPTTASALQNNGSDWYSQMKQGVFSINQPKSEPTSTPVMTPTVDVLKGLGSDVAGSFKNAQNTMSDVAVRQINNKQNIATTILQGLGVGAKLGNDIIGNGIKALIDLNVPKPVQDSIATHISDTINNNPLLKQGVDAAKQGMDKYNQWATANPKDAQTVSSLINIPLFAAQFIGAGEVPKVAESIAPKVEEVAGNVANKIGNYVSETKNSVLGMTTKSTAHKALDAITPATKDLTPTEYGDLLRAGKITPKTTTQPSTYILGKDEKALATKFEPLLQSGDPVKNINNLLTEVINKDKQVGDFLAKNPSVYVKQDLRDQLTKSLSQVNDVTIPKNQLASARQDLINTVMSRIPENNTGRTFDKLWQFRKEFDQTINNKLNAFSGSPTLKKEMATTLRNSIQDFISNNTPNRFYANQMKDMTQLYKTMDLVQTTAIKEKGLNAILSWARNNPTKARAIKGLLYGLGGYEALRGVGAPLP